jgi:hypothetical protein
MKKRSNIPLLRNSKYQFDYVSINISFLRNSINPTIELPAIYNIEPKLI